MFTIFSDGSHISNLSESNISTFLVLGGHNSQGLFILKEKYKYERNGKNPVNLY